MRTLNVRLAVILLGVMVVLGGGLYLLHGYQVERNAYVFSDQAQVALEKAKAAGKEKNWRLEQKFYGDAVSNLNWYVRLMPDNVDKREELGILLADRRAVGPAIQHLEGVLRQDPERQKARRRLVEMYMSVRDGYSHAKEHLEDYLLKQSPDDPELFELLGDCEAATGSYQKAASDYETAIGLSRRQIDAYPKLAGMLRYQLSQPAKADAWMKKLVEANPKSSRAHYLRGAYLRNITSVEASREAAKVGTEEAPEGETALTTIQKEALTEAQESLRLEPDNRDGLWLASICAIALRDVDQAREYANKGIKLYPEVVTLYIALEQAELQSRDVPKAVAALRDGLKATDQNPQLLFELSRLLINQKQLKEARETIDELRATKFSGQRPLADFLSAQVALVEGRWADALRGFEGVRGMFSDDANLLKQADVAIGRCYVQIGNRDQALEAFRRALKIDSFYAPAKQGETETLMATGKIDAARGLDQLKGLAKSLGGSIDPFSMVRTLMTENLQKPPAERKWEPVEAILDQAETATPGAAWIVVMRAEILGQRDRAAEAEKLLAAARDKSPKEISLWSALASLAEREDDWKKAETILADAEKATGDSVGLRLAKAQLAVRRDGNKATEQLASLAEGTDKFSDDERTQLWSGLLNASRQVRDAALTGKLCDRIAEKDPNNVPLRYLILDNACQASDLPAVERALKEVERVSGQSAYWHFGKAVLSSLQAKDAQNARKLLDDAVKHLEQARDIRPSWSRVPMLLAGIYDQRGETEYALRNYLDAFDMGERNPQAVRRMLQLLFATQRYDEADKRLRLIEKQGTVLLPELGKAMVESAIRQGDFERAFELAAKAISPDSKDYQDHLWLGQMLGILARQAKATGQAEKADKLLGDAEKALRRATALKPDEVDAWVALVQFLAAGEKEGAAEKVIQEMASRVPEKQSALATAQCFEVIKRPAAAEDKYVAALAQSPDDVTTVRAVADFYYRTGKSPQAEVQLRRLIDGKVKGAPSDVAWARRQLAMILAARSGYPSREKARSLIEQNLAESAKSVLDRRAMAELGRSDPQKSRREQAIQIMEDMLADQSARPDDQFNLALMYLRAGAWVKASETFRRLVATHGSDVNYLATYINALLEHDELSNAEVFLEQLVKLAPDHVYTVGLQADMMASRGESDKALDLLTKFVDRPNAKPAEWDVRVRMVSEKIDQIGRKLAKKGNDPIVPKYSRQAELFLRSYVDQNPGQEGRLAAFLAQQGRVNEAVDLLEQNWKRGNANTLAEACGVILRQAETGKAQWEQISQIVQSAKKYFQQSTLLTLVLADLETRQGRYSEAENLYRDVLHESPGQYYAMNNLAVLLALQGVKLDEALQLVNKAIDLAGPLGAMLDSRASVYLARKEPGKALADMNEALADEETAVRFFHQAAAFEAGGRRNAAAEAMESAQGKGLTKQMLMPLEYPEFEKLKALRP